uniref:Uncharacterized protein n=1 Tax=Molossus molossus TaxID=27622 RepID=A0A7J8E2Y3_MOLMO|nr:hypothetical protein HJG59_009071 [Molossus molossus]
MEALARAHFTASPSSRAAVTAPSSVESPPAAGPSEAPCPNAQGTIREIVLPRGLDLGLDLDWPSGPVRPSHRAAVPPGDGEMEFRRCQCVVGPARTELARPLNLSESQIRRHLGHAALPWHPGNSVGVRSNVGGVRHVLGSGIAGTPETVSAVLTREWCVPAGGLQGA